MAAFIKEPVSADRHCLHQPIQVSYSQAHEPDTSLASPLNGPADSLAKAALPFASDFETHFRRNKRSPLNAFGVIFQDLTVTVLNHATRYQQTVANYPLALLGKIFDNVVQRATILRTFDGMVEQGQLLLVLGRPGSGCSTLLKTLAGETRGHEVGQESKLVYNATVLTGPYGTGLPFQYLHRSFRGECIFDSGTDVHFPELTVRQTLEFAAQARTSQEEAADPGESLEEKSITDIVLAMFDLSHIADSKIGSDLIRGISGGERRRVSIAEIFLARGALQCWDNSIRGLDSATALRFVRLLQSSARVADTTAVVTAYQVSEYLYNLNTLALSQLSQSFDQVTLLYAGRQVFFGSTRAAKQYFTALGFECPPHATTSDFLTSLTNPPERLVREGFQKTVPQTAEEFEQVWRNSEERAQLLRKIDEASDRYSQAGGLTGVPHGRLVEAQLEYPCSKMLTRHTYRPSPYVASLLRQVSICLSRSYHRLSQNLVVPISGLIGTAILGVITGSVFYNLQADSSDLFSRGALIFFATMINATSSAFEVRIRNISFRKPLTRPDLLGAPDVGPETDCREAYSLRILPFIGGSNSIYALRSTQQAFSVILLIFHVVAAEYSSMQTPPQDVLLFQRNHKYNPRSSTDLEASTAESEPVKSARISDIGRTMCKPQVQMIAGTEDVALSWNRLRFEVSVGDSVKTVLDGVDGFIKPGTLTLVMVGLRAWKYQLMFPRRAYANKDVFYEGSYRSWKDDTSRCLGWPSAKCQTAWSICGILRRRANEGQAILCTIHQPSSSLFQAFDQLLLLQRGGKPVYFGRIGPDATTVKAYFEHRGANASQAHENPAEWLLAMAEGQYHPELGNHPATGWHAEPEYQYRRGDSPDTTKEKSIQPDGSDQGFTHEYATSFLTQALFVGLYFWNSPPSPQGLEDQIFSIFLLLTVFSNLTQLIMEKYVQNRSLFEARERLSHTYSWTAFMCSTILSEIPSQSVIALLMFASWYYPVGFFRHAGPESSVRAVLMFLYVWSFCLFTSTFSHMMVAGIEDTGTAVNIAQLFYLLSLIFCGVLIRPDMLPGFWSFMNRVSPLTYLLGGMTAVGLSGLELTCGTDEIMKISVPKGQICGPFLETYVKRMGGKLLNPEGDNMCNVCPLAVSDDALGLLGFAASHRWRDLGLTLAYVVFNIAVAFASYWLMRIKYGRGSTTT
ncbi:MAG: hypothetical protein Q9169_005271 [Polycauliona sp. 2 TL-2023]